MSMINNSLRDFEASLQAPVPPPTIDHATAAQQQVSQLGHNPTNTMAQTTILMVTMLNESRHESQQSRQLLSRHLIDTMNSVAQHDKDISEIKENVKHVCDSVNTVTTNQTNILNRLAAVESLSKHTSITAAETKQRSVKGNFIISGDWIPPYSPNEDLYQLLFPTIYQKYGIHIYWQELKALHRLPNNKVILSLLTRLPGQNFDNLMRAVNANPEPHIKMYISSQLMPPYSELHYIARRLKHNQLINRYRLDENGNTHIALAEHLLAFKFTGIDQLRQLNVTVPQPLVDEVMKRANQIKDSENRSISLYNNKAQQERPNFVPRQTNSNPNQRQPQTSASNSAYIPSQTYYTPSAAPTHTLNQATTHAQTHAPTQGTARHPDQPGPRQPSVAAPLVPPPNVLRQPPPSNNSNTAASSRPAQPSHPQPSFHRQKVSNQPPNRRPHMSEDGRPPASKYQRPSYSPPYYQSSASLNTPPPPGESPSQQSRFSGISPGGSNNAANEFFHTDHSTHRVSPMSYLGM